MLYAWEKFHSAIHLLVGTGTQRERLASAYTYNLSQLKPEDLPEEIQEDFRQLKAEITRVDPHGNKGSVKATLHEMDESDIRRMIEKIISMHDTVTRHQEPF